MRSYAIALFSVLALVAATPLSVRQSGACPAFPEQDYASFQISDGIGGNAAAEALAIMAPLENCDLTTVDADSLANIKKMRDAAEAAETDAFNPAIDAASGAKADALDVGKSKNKVLKHTLFKAFLTVQAAQGKDNAKALDVRQKKLDTNIKIDEGNAGAVSQAA